MNVHEFARCLFDESVAETPTPAVRELVRRALAGTAPTSTAQAPETEALVLLLDGEALAGATPSLAMNDALDDAAAWLTRTPAAPLPPHLREQALRSAAASSHASDASAVRPARRWLPLGVGGLAAAAALVLLVIARQPPPKQVAQTSTATGGSGMVPAIDVTPLEGTIGVAPVAQGRIALTPGLRRVLRILVARPRDAVAITVLEEAAEDNGVALRDPPGVFSIDVTTTLASRLDEPALDAVTIKQDFLGVVHVEE